MNIGGISRTISLEEKREKRNPKIVLPLAVALVGCLGPAAAQDRPAGYPNKPIRIVSSVQPGAGGDTMARVVASIISERWNANVVVENRSGAGATIAPEIAARATPESQGSLEMSTKGSF